MQHCNIDLTKKLTVVLVRIFILTNYREQRSIKRLNALLHSYKTVYLRRNYAPNSMIDNYVFVA